MQLLARSKKTVIIAVTFCVGLLWGYLLKAGYEYTGYGELAWTSLIIGITIAIIAGIRTGKIRFNSLKVSKEERANIIIASILFALAMIAAVLVAVFIPAEWAQWLLAPPK